MKSSKSESFLARGGDKIQYRKEGVAGIAFITMVLRPTGRPGSTIFNFIARDIVTNRELYLTDSQFHVVPQRLQKPNYRQRGTMQPDDTAARLFRLGIAREA